MIEGGSPLPACKELCQGWASVAFPCGQDLVGCSGKQGGDSKGVGTGWGTDNILCITVLGPQV